MDLTANVIVKAVAAASSGDQAQREWGNKVANELPKSPAAWKICEELIGHEAPEVQYFALNALYQKITIDQHELTVDDRDRLKAALSSLFFQQARAGNKARSFIVRRLASLVVAVTLRSNVGCAGLVAEVVQHAKQDATLRSASTLLLLLTVLPEEFDSISFTSYLESRKQLNGLKNDVLALIQFYLSHDSIREHPRRRNECLQCLEQWFSQNTPVSLGDLVASEVLPHVVSLLMQQECLHDASTCLAEAFATSRGREHPRHRDAVHLVCQCIGEQLGPVFRAASKSNAPEVCMDIANLTCAVAEYEVECLVDGSDLASKIVDLMILFLSDKTDGNRALCESALEFFTRLQDIPLVERHPSLQHGLFTKVLEILVLEQLALPEAFRTFDDDLDDFDMDEDAFMRFRAIAAEKVLVPAYFLLEGRYVEVLAGVLNSDAAKSGKLHWTKLESVMFSLTVIHEELAPRMNMHAVRSLLDQHFPAIFTAIFRNAVSSDFVKRTQCQLIGDYASWVRLQGTEVVDMSIAFLVQCFSVTAVLDDASAAFKKFCQVMPKDESQRLNSSSMLRTFQLCQEHLPPSSEQSIAADRQLFAQSFSNEDALAAHLQQRVDYKCSIYTGLGSLLDFVEDDKECTGALHALLGPLIGQLEASSSSQSSQSNAHIRAAVCENLAFLSKLVSSMILHSRNANSTALHPALSLVEKVFGLLRSFSRLWPNDKELVKRINDVFHSFLKVAGQQLHPALDMILETVYFLYEQSLSEFCLRTLSMCVETFAASSQQVVGKFAQVIDHLTNLTVSKTQQDLGSHADVVTAYVALCKRMVLECPQAILTSNQNSTTLVKCLNFSAKALANVQLFSSSHGTLLFWNTLLTLFQKAQRGNVLSSEAHACLGRSLNEFLPDAVRLLIGGLAENKNIPSSGYASALYAFLTFNQSVALPMFAQILQHPSFPSKRFQADDRLRFLRILESTLQDKFSCRSLLQDFGEICVGTATADALVAYEMRAKRDSSKAGLSRNQPISLD